MTQEDLPRSRLLAFPPVLRAGFRPFFLGGALWAVVVIVLWTLSLHGAVTLPTRFDPVAWHRHEMLFGYLGAVVGGFALTAVANWTGRLPVAGPLLASLVVLWAMARCAVLGSTLTGALPAMALDFGFLACLALVATREIVAGRNRNVPILAGLWLLAIAAVWDHAETLGWLAPLGRGWRLGFAVILVLVALIGGRIIPAFTRNWLAKNPRPGDGPAAASRFDAASVVVLVIALLGWTGWPEASATALLLVAASLLQAIRLSRWAGLRTLAEPIVFVLHASYAWLPIGLLLLGASGLTGAVPSSAAIHALGAGAMAAMTLAVMTRATLGHTGRPLAADLATRAIYLLLFAGAIVRTLASMLPFDYAAMLIVAATLWGGAMLLFVLRYAPVLLGPRPDGKP